MGLGGLSNTVAFGIKAVADLKGVDQTAKALTGLAQKGGAAGKGIARGMDAAGRSLDASRAKADAVAHSMRGITVAAGAIVGLGVGLFKIGESFDAAFDKIRVGTGATGKALAELEDDATAVFKAVPASLDTVAQAITELNRRTGDTGQGLRDLATAEIELAHITETDLNTNIEQTSKLFEQWGIAVGDQVGTLDKLFRASQSTGVSVGSLAGELVQYGPILRDMGFGLDQSIALLATLDKSGVDAGQVITGLRTAIGKFSADGVTDLGAALQDVFTQIKNAPSDVAAATIAIDTFGVKAGPGLAENIRSGRLGYSDLIDVVANGNETIHQASEDTQDFAEKMAILKHRVEAALEPLGTQLFNAVNASIPAMAKLAQGLGLIGSVFAKLPGPIKAGAGAIVGIAVSAAALTAVGARIVGVGASTIGAWQGVAGVFTRTAVAAEAAAGGITAAAVAADGATVSATELAVAETGAAAGATELGVASAASATGIGASSLALGGLALKLGPVAAGLVAIKLAWDDVNAIQHGGTAGLEGFAEKAGIAIGHGLGFIAGEVGAQSIEDSLNANMDDRALGNIIQNKLKDAGFHLDTHFGLKGGLDVDIKELGQTVGDFDKAQKASGLSIDDYIAKLKSEVPAIEAANKAKEAGLSVAEQQAAADAATALAKQQAIDQAIEDKNTQDAFNKSVKEGLNAQFLASGQFDEWMRPFIENSDDAQKAATDLKAKLDEFVAEGLRVASGVEDISSEFPGVQKGFRDLGNSVVDVTRDMDNMGVIDLSPAAREALDFASALDEADAALARVGERTSQDNADVARYKQNIAQVTDVTGANSDQIGEWLDQLVAGDITIDQYKAAIEGLATSGGFPTLDAALAQHIITQEQYDALVSASVGSLQRYGGALKDEQLQLFNDIIAQKKAQDAKDNANQSTKDLTDSQKELNAALDSDAGTDFLVRLEKLESAGASHEFITNWVVNEAQGNEDIHRIAVALHLIPGEVDTTVSANVNNAINDLKQVKGVIVDTTADGATIRVNADTEKAAQKFLDLNKDELDKLDGRELVVRVKGDDGKWQTTYDQVIGQTIPDKTVNVKANLDPFFTGEASAPDLGHVAESVKQPETGQPAPVVFTAEDKVTPVTEAIGASVSKLQTDVATAITSIAANVSDGIAQGFTNGENAARAGAIGILSALNVGQQSYNLGFNDGYDFSIGAANGILANWNAVFNAGFAIGQAADAGTRAGMQAHSPSRLAIKSGENWIAGVVQALRAGGSDVEREARDVFARMARVGSAPMQSPAMRALLTVDTRPQTLLAASINQERAGPRSVVLHQHNTVEFHGITDTKEIVGHVSTEFNRALDRGASAGLFEK